MQMEGRRKRWCVISKERGGEETEEEALPHTQAGRHASSDLAGGCEWEEREREEERGKGERNDSNVLANASAVLLPTHTATHTQSPDKGCRQIER